jgi:hypothetical protein
MVAGVDGPATIHCATLRDVARPGGTDNAMPRRGHVVFIKVS